MQKLLTLAVGILILTSLACQQKNAATPAGTADHPVFKLRVYKNGNITLDGQEVALDKLPATFADIKAKAGVLWYYREGSEGEPHPNAMVVMQAIAASKLA